MKKDIKTQRLEILAKIDVLDKERCEKCIGGQNTNEEMNCNCPAAVKVRKLGKEYASLATEVREKRMKALINELKCNGLSVELYQKLRETELTDKQIIAKSKMNKRDFVEWKADMKLTKTYKLGKTDEVKKPRETKLYERYGIRLSDFETARRNGISYNAVVTRLKRNWSVQRAITEPTYKKKAI